MMYLTVPTNYAEWMNVLDALRSKEDDATVLALMQRGTLEWQSGVADRFARSLVDVINARMNSATDRFQREITRSQGQERVLVPAIATLRKEFAFLMQAVNLPVIPEKDRFRYVQLVREQADKIQNALEDSSRSDRTGRLSSIIRCNRVNSF